MQTDGSKRPTSSNRSIFFALWIAAIIGSWSVIPYLHHLGTLPPSATGSLILLSTIQAALLYGVVCYLSARLLPKTDLSPFVTDHPLRTIFYPGLIGGIIAAVFILLLENTLFQHSQLEGVHTPFWVGLIASLYGAINEEILLRLFFFTLLYFLLGKVFRGRYPLFWTVNVSVALLFGLGHLPAAFKLVSPSFMEVTRILLLNGIPGLIFGFLYWSKGLFAAMTAHLITDILIHAVV